MNSNFRALWLASSKVISQVLFTSEQPKKNKMAFVTLWSASYSACVVYTKTIILRLVNIHHYSPPLRWIIVNYLERKHMSLSWLHVGLLSWWHLCMWDELVRHEFFRPKLSSSQNSSCCVNVYMYCNSHSQFPPCLLGKPDIMTSLWIPWIIFLWVIYALNFRLQGRPKPFKYNDKVIFVLMTAKAKKRRDIKISAR